jgi:hypothetical protein
MLSTADWTRMQADLAAVRGDNPVSITIRRGATTLAAQTVRVARTNSQGAMSAGDKSDEHRGKVVILGGTTLDIAPEDRFTVAGILYRVIVVRPNKKAAVVAEAESVT